MENASKALIIAGAILIAILLISVGVLIINSTSGLRGRATSTATELEVSSFNDQFTSYFGKSQTAAQARNLIQKVNINNKNSENPEVKLKSGTGYCDEESDILPGKTYVIEKSDEDASGYITEISITIKS